jgi:hypothetical protein
MVSVAPAYPSTPITGGYPVDLQVDPPQPQSRLTVFFRPLLAIPHSIIVGVLAQYALPVVALIAWFAILFTGRFPAGLCEFTAGVIRWQARANGYTYLLTGVYPPFALDEQPGYPVRTAITPQIENRNRLTTFFRIFMVIPHFIVLMFVGIAAVVVLIISWFAALITGAVPVGMHNFLAGTLRWSTRVTAYLFLLTDEYPPFSLS